MGDIAGKNKYDARKRRQRRVRAKMDGTAERPRLHVFRSLMHIYAQVINDAEGKTIVSASTIDTDVAAQVQGKNKTEAAKIVGQVVAERARNAGVEMVVFDRSGYKYHGRVAALAEGAREAGLKF